MRRLASAASVLMAAGLVTVGPTAAAAVSSHAGVPISAALDPCASASPSPSPSPSASSGARTSPSPTPFVGLIATPATGLADGQYVKVTFCNLQPFEAMSLRECVANFNPDNLGYSDWLSSSAPANLCVPPKTGGSTDATGNGSTYAPVWGFKDSQLETPASIGLNRDPATGGDPNLPHVLIPCDTDHACVLVGLSNYGNIWSVPFAFGPSPANCPQVGASALGGSGSASANRAMYRWSASTCQPPRSLPVQYSLLDDHMAYCNMFDGATDFGITSIGPYPPSPTGPPPCAPAGASYKLAPLTASGVVIAYRAYDYVNAAQGPQITNLTLTPALIAHLFMGQINNMGRYPGVAALNPGVHFPVRTRVFARAEYNSETYILTRWLASVAPNIWQPPSSPSPDIFPATGVELKTGETATAINVVNNPGGFDFSTLYIGLMDSSTAAFYGLPTLRIAMPDGSTLSANTDSILEGINASHAGADGTLTPDWNSLNTDPDAWPLPMVTYMIAPTNKIDPARGEVLAKFLRFALQDGQGMLADSDGYAHLPGPLTQAALGIADQIPPSPSPSPSPSPTAAALPPLPSLPPALPGGSGTGNGRTGTASSSRTAVASNSRIAALSLSQGVELAAVGSGEQGVPGNIVLLGLIGLTLLLIGGGIGLRFWASHQAGSGASPPP